MRMTGKWKKRKISGEPAETFLRDDRISVGFRSGDFLGDGNAGRG
jgi:hypothetical protein